MLLDALEKEPPRSVDELAGFFERSRRRLEDSLDKGQVSGEERARYLSQFQDGLNDAQIHFLNRALENQGDTASQPVAITEGPVDGLKAALRQPLLLALIAFALVLGLAVGVLLGS